MKKVLAFTMASVMLMACLTGCSSSSDSTTTTTESTTSTTSSSATTTTTETTADPTVINICGTGGVGDLQSLALEDMRDRLNDLGGWDAKTYVSSEMGSTDDVLEQALAGAAVTAASDPSRIAAYVPEIGILMMPYLFDDYSQLDSLMETELYKGWVEDMEEQGLILLTANGLTGWRNWVTNVEVNEPSDLNGVKIRTMGSTIAMNSVNAMGAVATALDQNEAYNGIATGVVDGGEWQISTISSLQLYEVCDHLSLSHHFLLTCDIVAGASWYNQLSEQQQVELSECTVGAFKDNQTLVIELEDQIVEQLKAEGMTVTEPDIQSFVDATSYLYSDMTTTGGVDFEALRVELYEQLGI